MAGKNRRKVEHLDAKQRAIVEHAIAQCRERLRKAFADRYPEPVSLREYIGTPK